MHGVCECCLAECGKPWLRTTIAYLDAPDMEWLAAIACCVYASVGTLAIGAVRAQSVTDIARQTETSNYTNRQIVAIVVCWLLVTIILSGPSLLYAASTSIPPDENNLGLGTLALRLFHNGAGMILFLITSIAVPYLADTLIKCVNGGNKDRGVALHLIMVARLMIALVVPFVAIFVLNQDCHAQWLKLWKPCNSQGSFQVYSCDLSVDWPDPNYCHGFAPALLVGHDQVCSPDYQASRCPRAVVDALGTLIVSKQIFAVFAAPPLALLMCTPWFRSSRDWVMRTLLCQPNYDGSKKIDKELVVINMLVDYPLVLGFCVPLLVPLSCLAMAQTAAVFHWARALGVEFSNMARPSTVYMWLSGCSGLALNAWVFIACDLDGKYVVATAAPLIAVCSAWASHKWLYNRADDQELGELVDLTPPLLLGSESEHVQHPDRAENHERQLNTI